jgi:hypothetical protein
MALHTSAELGAITQGCIIGKGLGELGKLPKILNL